jgi:hypothetical protein
MRTTRDIDDDILAEAERLAKARNMSVGKPIRTRPSRFQGI